MRNDPATRETASNVSSMTAVTLVTIKSVMKRSNHKPSRLFGSGDSMIP
ncbi:MAG: hypothetical protein QF738_01230 [Rhodospirillales bacterium]|nr:hypothetical protein [Rhodospirillales bacterium]